MKLKIPLKSNSIFIIPTFDLMSSKLFEINTNNLEMINSNFNLLPIVIIPGLAGSDR
jgi:hypothetical protein